MKIGVNLIPYSDLQGIEIFTKNILKELVRQYPSHDFVFFTNQKSKKLFSIEADNIIIVNKVFKRLSKISFIIYQQLFLPYLLKKNNIDILFCPSLSMPLFYKNKIVTVHDCIPWHFQNGFSFFSKLYLNLARISCRFFSKGIVTVSNFSRKDIANIFHLVESKVNVISEGIPEMSLVTSDTDKLVSKFNIVSQKYFLYVGNMRKHKNVFRVIQAFAEFSKKNDDYQLVLVIRSGYDIIENLIEKFNLNNKVIITGYVSEEEKTFLYKNSSALVFPSLYEGFGLPILEAQSLGIPVITSNIGAMIEIAGDSALLVDPYDHIDISKGMSNIYCDMQLRSIIIEKGFQNICRFSWKKSAKLLGDILIKK